MRGIIYNSYRYDWNRQHHSSLAPLKCLIPLLTVLYMNGSVELDRMPSYFDPPVTEDRLPSQPLHVKSGYKLTNS